MTTVEWNDFNGTTNFTINYFRCTQHPPNLYKSFIGIELAVSIWEALVHLIVLGLIIILTIFGNVLVILSVFTYKPLRTVQNFFIVSLAVADLTVAVLVLPLNVAYTLLGRWLFGKVVCTMWLTSDVMCCTASILNLCAIALDRYWAITDPINYAQKRTIRRVMCLIVVVWLLSALICSPPLIGWNDWPEEFDDNTPCRLTSQQGYVIYSSLGSFYIPLLIMTTVYIEIFVATRRRLRKRAKASKLNSAKNCIALQNNSVKEQQSPIENDRASDATNHNTPHGSHKEERRNKGKKKKIKWHKEMIGYNASHPAGEDPMDRGSEVRDQPTTHTGNALDVQPERSLAVYQFIEEKQKISLSKERRAARTLGIIMGVFVICWLPFFLTYIVLPFCGQCCPSPVFINFITWLGYINSALNPIIYTIFNLDFRTAIKKLLHINQMRDS